MKSDDGIPLTTKHIDDRRIKTGGWLFYAAAMVLSALFAYPDKWQDILLVAGFLVVLGVIA